VKIHGQEIRVQATIKDLDIYSGHVDGKELVEWILERQPIQRALFLTHGNPESMAEMKAALWKLVYS